MMLDETAIARLRDEPVDWRYKGMPPDVSTVDDLIGRRVPVEVAVQRRPDQGGDR